MSNSLLTTGSYLNVSTLGQNLRVRQDISMVRSSILEAQTQISSGMKSTTHGGLRADATAAQQFRHQMGRLDGYAGTIGIAESRLSTVQASLSVIQTSGSALSMQAKQAVAPGFVQDIQMARVLGKSNLETMISKLNTTHGNRYLFSGAEIDNRPVATAASMIEGSGSQRGLREVVALRLEADMGAGDGRVAAASNGVDTTTVTHTGGAFGMKLAGISTNSGVATLTQPTAGVFPAVAATVQFTGVPTNGERFTVTFTMPDGETRDVTLIASNTQANGSAVSGSENTYYMSTVGVTADNMRDAIDQGISGLVSSALTGHSAVAAGNDFFDHQVARIPSGAAATATEYAFDSGSVVSWYQGGDAVPAVNGQAVNAAALPPAAAANSGQTYLVDAPTTMIATSNGVSWDFTEAEDGIRFIDEIGHMRVADGGVWRDDGLAPPQDSARDSVRSKVDDGLYLSYGAQANEAGVRDTLKGAALLVAAAYDEANPAAFKQVAWQAGNMLSDAHEAVISQRSDIGVVQERLDATRERQKDYEVVLTLQLDAIEGIDDFEVSTRLQDLLSRLEASYSITARLSQMSLANYL